VKHQLSFEQKETVETAGNLQGCNAWIFVNGE